MNRIIFRAITFAGLAVLSGTAAAHDRHFHHFHHRAHFGVVIGIPLPGYYAYPYPYYPYYPPVVVQSQPPVYVEQSAVSTTSEQTQTNWWYYCAESKSYYPYVKQCPGGWQKVSPTPPQ